MRIVRYLLVSMLLALARPARAQACAVSADCEVGVCIEHSCARVRDVLESRDRRRRALFDPVARHYVGASVAAFGGLGLEGRNITAAGGDVFGGVRFRRWFSLEWFYAYDVEIGHSPLPPAGAFCPQTPPRTWIGDWYRWQVLGVRPWFHAVHGRVFDLSFAPMIAGGFYVDHTSGCGGPNFVSKGPVFETGTSFALELRPTRWLGVRLMTEALLDVGVSVVAVRAALGPVVRF